MEAGACEALSNFPLPLKIMVHCIGLESGATSVNRMMAPPCLGISKAGAEAPGYLLLSAISSIGRAWGDAPASAA